MYLPILKLHLKKKKKKQKKKKKKKKKTAKDSSNYAYAMLLYILFLLLFYFFFFFFFFFFFHFLFKSIYCRYSLELHRQVDAIQTVTHNIYLFIKKSRQEYTSCNMQTTCAYRGMCGN